MNPNIQAMPGLSHHILASKANGFGFFLVNGDNDRPDAFKDFATVLDASGIDNEVMILPDTNHNLGLYYDRSASRMLAFLGKHLTRQ